MNILIDTHFKIRWNERINEKSTYKDITKFIKKCIYNNKFELYWKNNYFLIDNDIIIKAKVKTKDEKIVFIRLYTVSGRISETPALNNLPLAIQLKNKYGKMFNWRKNK